MSNLLMLAKDLEQKSKEQQKSTSEMLKAAFSEHEKSVKAELSASAERISDAISAQEKGMKEIMQSTRRSILHMVGRTWLTMSLVSVLLIASSGGVLWWQGRQIVSNLEILGQQETTLAKLNASTWGVSYQTDVNGQFLVLPKGMKAETGWTVGSAKRNAVRLVRE